MYFFDCSFVGFIGYGIMPSFVYILILMNLSLLYVCCSCVVLLAHGICTVLSVSNEIFLGKSYQN